MAGERPIFSAVILAGYPYQCHSHLSQRIVNFGRM